MNNGFTITYEYGKNLYVNTTNRCNYNCNFCVRHNSHLGAVSANELWLKREPAVAEIVDSIEKRDLSKYNQLVFCGFGEPSFRFDDICTVIDTLKADGHEIFTRMDTNGSGRVINGRDVCPDMKGRFDKISISLNISDSKKYDNLCHPDFDGAFDEMKKFAKEAKRYVPEVMMTVVDCISDEEIESCRRICEDEIGATFRVRSFITEEHDENEKITG